MGRRATFLLTAAAAALFAAAPALAREVTQPALAISASPFTLTLEGASEAMVTVTNPSKTPITVQTASGDYAVSERGHLTVNPRKAPPRSARAWLHVFPAQLTLAPNSSGTVTLTSDPPADASPGDHQALALLTTIPSEHVLVGIRTQIGVSVLIRIPGTIQHKLTIANVKALTGSKRHALQLELTNQGNIQERLAKGALQIELDTNHGKIATAAAPGLDLLPGTKRIVSIPLHNIQHGTYLTHIRITDPGGPQLQLTAHTRF